MTDGLTLTRMESSPLTAALVLLAVLAAGVLVEGCNMHTKEVGVCLHVYLERDFLTMERIVYPKRSALRREMLYNSYGGAGLLQELPNLTEFESITTGGRVRQMTAVGQWPDSKQSPGVTRKPGMRQTLSVDKEARGRHKHHLQGQADSWRRISRSAPDDYAVIDAYGQHGWVEGPELEDYCSRLATVIRCFEDVLVECNSGYDFFRYRHLLHSLDRVHTYLCHTALDRSTKFLPFLKVINCAEKARLGHTSCHRPNITVNVWNQILRLEVGPELCDSLNTQRSCLLQNEYVQKECGGQTKEELYKNVSGVFLATWCRLPLQPHLLPFSRASSQHITAFHLILFLLLLHVAIS